MNESRAPNGSPSLAPINLAISSFNLLGKETSEGYVHWWVLFLFLIILFCFVLVYFFHSWRCPEVNSWHCTQHSLLTGLGRVGGEKNHMECLDRNQVPPPKNHPPSLQGKRLSTVLSLRPRMFTLFGKCAHSPPLFFFFYPGVVAGGQMFGTEEAKQPCDPAVYISLGVFISSSAPR